ncbi:galactitol-1-phosphate 5-dehydrogenase [Propionivibrio limicola]|uniref:galactitol-1-phosphate 5-dehydrogenase n=1 Tax=Propionivibrio limicola TaxID=167645 RepID=UPI001290C336|nr:galactitol-1-phosphate 5-dehydrogenase [Propionivibrio limicola]
MKALVLKEYSKFSYEDVPMPEIGAGEVLIRVKACGICGSDVHGMDGSTGRRIPPIIMGHEASGVVERIGGGVTEWNAGDRVTFDSTVVTRQDFYSQKGLFNLSDYRKVLGVSCGEYRQHGAFAEYVAVPQSILYRLPESLSFEHAAMVEPVSVAFHAANLIPSEINDSALVVGCGMIGLFVIQALRVKGCGKIIAVDLDPSRLDMALQLGADCAIRSDEGDVIEKIKGLTHGRGTDMAFEVVGITPTVNLAINAVRKGGKVGLIGNLSPKVEIPLQAVVTRQLTLYGSCASAGEYPACLDMIASGRVKVDEMISAVVPLSEAASWFHRLYKGEPGLMKVIVKPE